MDMERYNLKKLNEGKLKKGTRLQSQTSLQLCKTSEDNGYINTAWDITRENNKILAKDRLRYCESVHHKSWCDEECPKLVDEGSRLNYVI
jgi:hypothetical protein